MTGAAVKYGSDLDLLVTALFDLLCNICSDQFISGYEELLLILQVIDVLCSITSCKTIAERLNNILLGTCHVGDFLDPCEVIRTAVFLGNDNVLGNIDETTCQVTGVSCLKSCIGERFTGTVRTDEEL